ncbi:hypothetical protein EGW08_002279 [Elysia chlorotica]|uniref:Uncharacterized protein n=1 Tax=Elysia chlorotica TaxID=188477 RepID=A0A3S1CDR6_ELYCH|nr:hypothetical protein EGW08_002279 [Elysia chlorotica]
MDDVAGILARDGDNVDSLMLEINNLINRDPVQSPLDDIKSKDDILNTQIKKEDGSGFVKVSSLTKALGKAATGDKAPLKQKKGKKPASSKSKMKSGPKLPTQNYVTSISVKQEPLSSDDEFSDIVKNTSSQSPIDQDEHEPSTSSGTSKSIIKETQSSGVVAHGFKLNATPVVVIERLDHSAIASLLSKNMGSQNEVTTNISNASSDEYRSSGPRRSEKKSASRRNSSTTSDSSHPKSKPNQQIGPSATGTYADKSKSDIAIKTSSPFLASVSEQSAPPGTTKFELVLSPILLADLSSEPFRKFMNLALDCVVHFRKNQNQPLFGNICLYFGDFVTLQSAMQRLCQLSVKANNMRLNGTIRCYDFKRLCNKSVEEPAKRSLAGRLMFQFCSQRIEKLQQLASVKDRKKESTKMRSALVNKIPALANKEMLLLLFPFSLDVTMPGDNQQRGLKGPVSIAFESQEWMEAVLDCMRDLSVNMSSSSDTELGTFRLYVKNFTPPKIPSVPPPTAPIRSLVSSQPGSPAIRGRGRGYSTANVGRAGPNREQRASADRQDSRTREKENTAGRAGQRQHSDMNRKRPHEDHSRSRFQFSEKRSRFDGQKNTGTPSDSVSSTVQDNQAGASDPKEAIRLAAIDKGLDPNNPDIIKILEMSSQLQALQKARSPGGILSKSPATGPSQARVAEQQQLQAREQREPPEKPFHEKSGLLGSPPRFLQQSDRVFPPRDFHHSDLEGSVGHPRPDLRRDQRDQDSHGRNDHRRDQDSHARTGDGPKQFAQQREWGGHAGFSPRGGFINGPRDRMPNGLHSRSRDALVDHPPHRDRVPSGLHNRSRDSPDHHPPHRDRNRPENRSRSPHKSTPSSSSSSLGNAQRAGGFEQWGGRAEALHRGWEPNSNNLDRPDSYFDPNSNDQPLDFHRPAPTLSTEQAVQQDMARTIQQAMQHGDGPQNQTPFIPRGPINRQPQQKYPHQLPAEELVLPLQFGKNAVKKTPQAILEEKRQKEREERQKKEMELRQKREEEEKQRREAELEERRKREREETEKREKELEARHRNQGAFTPGKVWQRQRSHHDDPPREQFEPLHLYRPASAGVRFQGEELFETEGFQPETRDSHNVWERADRAEGTPQRGGLRRPIQGAFQKHDQPLNAPARRNFEHGMRSFEEPPQNDGPPEAWRAGAQIHEDSQGGASQRMAVRGRPRGRWSDEGIQRFEPTGLWDAQDQPTEGSEGGYHPERNVPLRGVPRSGRRSAGQPLIHRAGLARGVGDRAQAEHKLDCAAPETNREVFRGRGARRALQRGPVGASSWGRGVARGAFSFHAEGHQGQPEHFDEHEASDNRFVEPVSNNDSVAAFSPQERQRRSPHRRPFENRDDFGRENATAGYEVDDYWKESNSGNLSQRGGLRRAHPQGHHETGPERTRAGAFESDPLDAEWSETNHEESSQFQQTGFAEDRLEPRVHRGRAGILRPGRGFRGRARGVGSFGRGYGGLENSENSHIDDSRADHNERLPEFQEGREVNDQELRTPMQRGRGLSSRIATTVRGGANLGRGMFAGRGADNRGRGNPSSRGSENQGGRGMPVGRGSEMVRRGMPLNRGSEIVRGRGMPSNRGSEIVRGRGMPSNRGADIQGERGTSLDRGKQCKERNTFRQRDK